MPNPKWNGRKFHGLEAKRTGVIDILVIGLIINKILFKVALFMDKVCTFPLAVIKKTTDLTSARI